MIRNETKHNRNCHSFQFQKLKSLHLQTLPTPYEYAVRLFVGQLHPSRSTHSTSWHILNHPPSAVSVSLLDILAFMNSANEIENENQCTSPYHTTPRIAYLFQRMTAHITMLTKTTTNHHITPIHNVYPHTSNQQSKKTSHPIPHLRLQQPTIPITYLRIKRNGD